MENSAIEWTDHTFNPWSGCAKVSPGCANCYAETLAKRFPSLGDWGPGAERKRTSEANWQKPLTWNRAAAKLASKVGAFSFGPSPRPRVFCASLADWLDPEVPAEWLADLLALIAATPNLDWLLLTKRPRLWRERLNDAGTFMEARELDGYVVAYGMIEAWLNDQAAPSNVWLGTTVEDQQRADERLPLLLQIPARIRFLSCEPLLGPVDLTERWSLPSSMTVGAGLQARVNWSPGIHWVICGGESGPGARPMHPDWARSLRDQCQAADVAFFFKQWGEWAPSGKPKGPGDVADGGGVALVRVGKHSAGRLLDGHEWSEAPDA